MTERHEEREERFPRGLWVRLLIYIVGGHVFAAFLWLLFEAGARQ